MIAFLRFVGVVNAAIWFGATFFFTFIAGGAFFSDEMKHFIPPPYNGIAAEIVIARLFILHHVCGALALLHLLAEWLYAARPVHRATLALLVVLVCLNSYGGFALQPRLKRLHVIKYSPQTKPADREAAASAFSSWHGVSMVLNLAGLGGLLAYFWHVVKVGPATTAAFIGSPKFGIDKRN